MSRILSLFILILISQTSFAAISADKSAVREQGVSYKAYMLRAKILSQGQNLTNADKSAVDSAEVFRKANLPSATKWESEEAMIERFKSFRDLRFLEDPEKQDFKRRSSWLYPDDGCFARAALAIRNVGLQNVEPPSKVFVFGDLNVKTKNAPGGSVGWWYHVAPLVEVDGQKYVLDPAIEPNHPLKLEDWLATMSSTPQELEVAVCKSGTYTPYTSCGKVTDGEEKEAERDQKDYLRAERSRLKSLGRNADQELGDNPPWN